jgi:hypothetical protein
MVLCCAVLCCVCAVLCCAVCVCSCAVSMCCVQAVAKLAPKNLRCDKEVVMAALSAGGHLMELLQYMSLKTRADTEIVMAIVTRCGSALQHASGKLQGDRTVVLAAASILLRKIDALRAQLYSWGLRYFPRPSSLLL